jgi:hypothetical protein
LAIIRNVKELLLAVGAALELVGIVLVGSPDLFPQAARVSAWLQARSQSAVDRLRAILGRGRDVTVTVGAADAVAIADNATVMKAASEGASLEEKIEFLLRRDQEAQRDVNDLRTKLAAIEGNMPEQLEQLRWAMEEHVNEALIEAHRRYLPLRVIGAVALAAGLVCVTVATFL